MVRTSKDIRVGVVSSPRAAVVRSSRFRIRSVRGSTQIRLMRKSVAGAPLGAFVPGTLRRDSYKSQIWPATLARPSEFQVYVLMLAFFRSSNLGCNWVSGELV